MIGWTLSVWRRYVTDLMVGSNSVGMVYVQDCASFFFQAVWNMEDLRRLLAKLIVDRLIGNDALIVHNGDDALCPKRRLGIFGAGMHH